MFEPRNKAYVIKNMLMKASSRRFLFSELYHEGGVWRRYYLHTSTTHRSPTPSVPRNEAADRVDRDFQGGSGFVICISQSSGIGGSGWKLG